MAKKRDASTDLLRRLHGYMKQHNVDFIGGDFNMSAFSTVGDVFSDTEFSAPGNSCLWGLGALEEPNRGRTGFLIMPKRPYDWRVDTLSMRNKEGLSADITNTSVCGDDGLDCDVAHQSHVSAHLFPFLSITCESLGASCFAPH